MARRSSRVVLGIEDAAFAPRPAVERSQAAPQGPAAAVIDGTAGDDSLVGTEDADTLSGLGGNDLLRGLGGDDILNGGDGNDRLDGGGGADLMTGGWGNDVYVVGAVGDQTVELAGQGVDSVEAWISWTLADNLENLTLFGGAVTGIGNGLINWMTGTDGANYLYGRGGNDTIMAGLGNDVLYGEEGNDRLNGGAGDDVMNGGLGNDVFVVGSLSDQTHELAGEGVDLVEAWVNHALWVNVENLTLFGAAQYGSGNILNNVITGNDLDNYLYGNGGNDFLYGGIGADNLYGGDGDDFLDVGAVSLGPGNVPHLNSAYGGAGNDLYIHYREGDLLVENAGEGTDTVRSYVIHTLGANFENLVLVGGETTGPRTGTGNGLNNVITYEGHGAFGAAILLYGLGGDDTLDMRGYAPTSSVQGGFHISRGGDGNDTLYGSAYRDELRGDDGNDVADGGDGSDHLWGGAGDDILSDSGTHAGYLTQAVDRLYGEAGADTLRGGTGGDELYGGADNDTLWGEADDDFLYGGSGDDTVHGGDGADQLYGDQSANREEGYGAPDGNDVLYGGAGNDRLYGQGGSNTLDGGDGTDYAHFAAARSAYSITYNPDGTWTIARAGETSVLTNIEFAVFSNQTVALIPPINGTAGDDALSGTAGDDVINGLEGADTLQGLGGQDILNGGDGADYLDGGSGSDTLSGGAGDDTYVVDVAGDTVSEGAGAGIDTVLSSAAAWTLGANVENLTLAAGAQSGVGNALNNVITGNGQANSLRGAGGSDTLTGGGGADTFLFAGGDGADTITDFGTDDVLALSGLFSDFADVLANTADDGNGNCVITSLANGVSITLLGFTKAQLTAANVQIPGGAPLSGLDPLEPLVLPSDFSPKGSDADVAVVCPVDPVIAELALEAMGGHHAKPMRQAAPADLDWTW